VFYSVELRHYFGDVKLDDMVELGIKGLVFCGERVSMMRVETEGSSLMPSLDRSDGDPVVRRLGSIYLGSTKILDLSLIL
jgi:hypothetical protein